MLLALSASAFAQEDAWYRIELVVFENNDVTDWYTEAWPQDPGYPDIANAIELVPPAPDTEAPPIIVGAPAVGELVFRAMTAASTALTTPFQLLPVEKSSLGPMEARLMSRGTYRPLVHLAWLQPVGDPQQARAVRIHMGAGQPNMPGAAATSPFILQPRPEPLDGTVTVSRGRYLHADVDLLYSKPLAIPPRSPAVPSGASGESADRHHDLAPDAEPAPYPFRLIQSRRMRSNELHYLDHPLFGILISLAPYEPETIGPLPQ